MNKERLAKVMNQILENPETWDQTKWHCGSSHCFAGWAQVMSGKEEDDATAGKDAQEWLGIDDDSALYLFDGGRDLIELFEHVSELVNGRLPLITVEQDQPPN